ncbi:hypothetical protein GCM10010413_10180 [Promicromonospora sukumoe]|uniref:Uncharacterized protein n=1 Tax=Promicromonospora sukumoe TaxID=88382 RepID=A0A7W3PCI2_9MICO|nr:hypothetical protein [Promicromonospora sukumoe]MBA8806681.1 hypothetical protein [Promicromonospora sukumoe]
MALFRRRTPRTPEGTDAAQAQAQAPAPAPVFRLGSLRLYQPEDELRARLPGGAGEIAAYAQTLAWTCNEFLSRLGQDAGSLGILIVVGVKPSQQVRLWCEQVGGTLPDDVWQVLTELLDGAGAAVRPQVTAPVALALEGLVGAGPSTGFPEFPRAWVDAVERVDAQVSVPDGLFERVFVD